MAQKDVCSEGLSTDDVSTKYFIEDTTKKIFSIPKRPINETDQETLDFLKTKKMKLSNFLNKNPLAVDNDIKGTFIPLTVPLSIKPEFDLNNNLLEFFINDDEREKCHRWFKIGYCGAVYFELDFFTFVMLQCQSESGINNHVKERTIYEHDGTSIIRDIDYSHDYFEELRTKKDIGDDILDMCSQPYSKVLNSYLDFDINTELEGMLLEDLNGVLTSEKKFVQELVYNSSLKSEYNPDNKPGSQEIEKLISCVSNGKTCNNVWEFLKIYFNKCLGTRFYNENFSDTSFYNIITSETSQKNFCSKSLSLDVNDEDDDTDTDTDIEKDPYTDTDTDKEDDNKKDVAKDSDKEDDNKKDVAKDSDKEDDDKKDDDKEVDDNKKDVSKDYTNSNKDIFFRYVDKKNNFKFLKNVLERFDDTLEIENIETLLKMSFKYLKIHQE